MIDFKMVVADWGSAYVENPSMRCGQFYGGTPVYAGPGIFNYFTKDLFSFGRMAMELFMEKSETVSKLNFNKT